MNNKNNTIVHLNKKYKGLNNTYSSKILASLGIGISCPAFSAAARNDDLGLMAIEQQKLLATYEAILKKNRLFLIENKHYKGVRYAKGLPANGQRTHTNAKTSRKLKNV